MSSTKTRNQGEQSAASVPLPAASPSESAAPLIAAFAHELNSALSGAKYALSSVLNENDDQVTEMARDTEHLRDALLAVRSSLEAGAGIVSQALEYARLGRLAPGDDMVDVLPLVEKLNKDLKKSLDSQDVALIIDVSPKKLRVAMKEAHLYAILRNLVSNACDAISTRPGSFAGKINVTVRTSGTRIDIKVEDNGIGIPETIRSKIFQPFFTTKRHKGTGIGLGFCRQIAALYGGSIDWESGTEGTTFKVLLHAENKSD